MSGDASEVENTGDEEILEQMDSVREQMDEVRGKLDGDIDRLSEGMKQVFDWQAYVRSAPLTSVGVAAAVGYLFAPAIRSRPLPQAASAQASGGGIFGTIATLAVSAAVRFAMGYVTDIMTSTVAPDSRSENPKEFNASPGDDSLDLGL